MNREKTHIYTAYGFSATAHSAQTLLRFNGERLESTSRNYLLGQGHRSYSPILMRFSAPDGLSPFREGGVNSYAYCANDPINRVDPDGKFFTRLRNFLSRTPSQTERLQRRPSIETQHASSAASIDPPPAYSPIPTNGEKTAEINLGPPIEPLNPFRYVSAQTEALSSAYNSSTQPTGEFAKQIADSNRALLVAKHGLLKYRQAQTAPQLNTGMTFLSTSKLNKRYREGG